jgi:N-[(2S)-2-amino-2-carboxyethyl]-L-glutamate dehydrogenase
MITSSDICLLSADDVLAALKKREADVIDVVRTAHEMHARGDFVLPHSVFLQMPGADGNRGIALPALLGGKAPILGMKWISSFPNNIHHGVDRASAIIVLNDPETGRPRAVLEGSVISAVRTAASAALASQLLAAEGTTACCGIIGCGRVNFEIVRFLRATHSQLRSLVLYDIDFARAEAFKSRCRREWPECAVNISRNMYDLTCDTQLLSFATTASTPHFSNLGAIQSGSLILHVSLRDLSPQVILACDNVVDDIDHVCRENTSVHLAERLTGSRKFIRCTLGDILLGRAKARSCDKGVLVFSPFGMGILDLAVARYALELALPSGRFRLIDSFLPDPCRVD